MPDELRLLTFNTWMLRTPFGVDIARHVDERARLIPRHVARTGADIVALQEVWDPDLRQTLIEGFEREGLPHSAFRAEPSGENEALAFTSMAAALGPLLAAHGRRDPALSRRKFLRHCALFAGGFALNAWGAGSLALGSMRRSMGNGLLIVSRFPIEPEVAQLRFSRHTRLDETVVLKGAIRARVLHPSLGPIDVFNSHLGAVSYEPEHSRYSAAEARDRLHQAEELAEWIRAEATAELAFLAADLNVDFRRYENGSYVDGLAAEYRLMTETLGWEDAGARTRSRSFPEVTDDSANPYKTSGHFKRSPDCLIDYVFARPTPKLTGADARIVFKEALGTSDSEALRLSDHYGVLSTFRIG